MGEKRLWRMKSKLVPVCVEVMDVNDDGALEVGCWLLLAAAVGCCCWLLLLAAAASNVQAHMLLPQHLTSHTSTPHLRFYPLGAAAKLKRGRCVTVPSSSRTNCRRLVLVWLRRITGVLLLHLCNP